MQIIQFLLSDKIGWYKIILKDGTISVESGLDVNDGAIRSPYYIHSEIDKMLKVWDYAKTLFMACITQILSDYQYKNTILLIEKKSDMVFLYCDKCNHINCK